MSKEKRKEERRGDVERRSGDERRKALADWDDKDWQPESDVDPKDERRENARRQMVLEQRTEDRRKD